MSIGAIGDVIFTNQMTTCATNVQNAHNNRVELQNMIAQSLANEKEKEIEAIPETQEDKVLIQIENIKKMKPIKKWQELNMKMMKIKKIKKIKKII